MLDSTETWKRSLKYLLCFCFVSLVTRYVPIQTLLIREILMIGFSSSIVFALLDIYSPAISMNTKQKIKESFN
jgi:hypothetical protein